MKDVRAVATIFDDQGRVLLDHQTYKGIKRPSPEGEGIVVALKAR